MKPADHGEFVSARLPGGLDAWVWRRRGFQNRQASLAARFGSADARFVVDGSSLEVPDGTAHFLEHKAFEDEAGNALALFSRLGVRANAFTSYGVTSYYFTGTDNFWPALRRLVGLVTTSRLTAAGVEAEKRVIAQEIRMYEDSPETRVLENLHQALYHHHPVRRRIAGTLDSIAAITPEILRRCHGAFYHPANLTLVAAGDLEPDRVFATVAEELETLGVATPAPAVQRTLVDEPIVPVRPKVRAEMPITRPAFLVGFKDRPVGGECQELLGRETALDLAAEVLFGSTSPLRDELYRKGLIDDSFSYRYTCEPTYAHLSLGGTTTDPDQVLDRLLEGIAHWRQKGIASTDLERKRRKALGQFAGLFDSPGGMATLFLLYRMKGCDIRSYPEVLGGITVEAVNDALSDLLVPERCSVSIVSGE